MTASEHLDAALATVRATVADRLAGNHPALEALFGFSTTELALLARMEQDHPMPTQLRLIEGAA